MAEKEYIISLKRGVDYTAFDEEMQAGIGRGLITDRTVDVANARPLSQRNTHRYSLRMMQSWPWKRDVKVCASRITADDNSTELFPQSMR